MKRKQNKTKRKTTKTTRGQQIQQSKEKLYKYQYTHAHTHSHTHTPHVSLFCIFSIFTEINKHHQCQMEITRIGNTHTHTHTHTCTPSSTAGWEGVLAFAFYETISKCETNSHKILSAACDNMK